MAKKVGLSLEEAATQPSEARRQDSTGNPWQVQEREPTQRFTQAVHLMDHYLRTDKARREAALRVAQGRGLDGAERAAARRNQDRPISRRRMAPNNHAAVLLRETSFSFREISDITGLNVYDVVGMKLKMRAA